MSRTTIIMVLAICAAAASLRADVVQTAAERLTGEVNFAGGKVSIASKTIEWKDVLSLAVASRTTPLAPTEMVQFKNGDLLSCQIASITSGKADVQSLLAGRLELRVADLAQLLFIPGAAAGESSEKGTLYRTEGESVPGELQWLDSRQIAIDSPLGPLTLKRDTAARYVFGPVSQQASSTSATTSSSAPAATTASAPAGGASASSPALKSGDEFELVLVDGSRLTGTVLPQADKLVLGHPILGSLSIAYSKLRSVRSAAANVTLLNDIPVQVEGKALLAKAVAPQKLSHYEGSGKQAGMALFGGLKIQPETTLAYKLQKGSARRLIATLFPVDGALGSVRLRISSGKSVLFDQEVSGSSDGVPLNLALTESDDLLVEVLFGSKVKFPCGIVLGEAMVVTD